MASDLSEQGVSSSCEFTNSSEDTISTEISLEETNELTAERVPNEFSLKTWKEDLTLVVEGKELYVASIYLALESPVFSAKFDEAFKEDGPRILELPGSYDDFVEFLRCIYPSIKKQVTEDNVLKVSPLAHEYQVENVKATCEEMLYYIVSESSVERLSSMLNNPSLGQISTLRQMCIEEMSTRKELSVDEHFDERLRKLQIPHDIQMWIMKTKNKRLEENEHHLKISRDEEREKHKELEVLVRNFWLEDLKTSNAASFELRRLNVKISNDDSTKVISAKARDITWTLSVCFGVKEPSYLERCILMRQQRPTSSGKNVDIPELSVALSARGCYSWGNWTFKCKASCCLSKGSIRVWKGMSHLDQSQKESKVAYAYELDKFSSKEDLSVSVIFVFGDVLVRK